MSSPKVVIIGAGSFFFGKAVVWNMAHSPILRNGTLAMVDTNKQVLDTMMEFGKKVFQEMNAPVKLIGSTDRREVMRDADFVVLSFSEKNAYYRGVDCRISAKYGVRMCSGDTIGPGGIFRALREIPRALAMAKDAAELAPQAWVINYVNPTSVLGIALMRYAPRVKSFAICDGPHEPYARLTMLKQAGILPPAATAIPPEVMVKLDLRVMGLNHFSWVTTFKYGNADMLPVLRERLVAAVRNEQQAMAGTGSDNNAHAKAKFNAAYTLELMDIYGAYPDRIAHTKEYVPYFQGLGVKPNLPEPIAIFDAEERARQMAAYWQEVEDLAAGRKPIAEFVRTGRVDHATDIIESMWGHLGKPFSVNTPNRGAVTNMADDAFLELYCDLDMHGIRPRPLGAMPRGLLGLQQQVLDTHELTAEAAVTCDRQILLRAMMTDPIINNYEDGKAIMHELLEAERDILPVEWYK